MFGYVRLHPERLAADTREGYEALYCGLCRQMGKAYGAVSRWFLNYDFVFLAMLLAQEDSCPELQCLRCPRHPVRGKKSAVCGEKRWMETAAGESVILSYWKLRDTAADGGALSRLGAGLLSLLLRPGYKRAGRDFPAFDRGTKELLEELFQLEAQRCPSIDRTADCFARLLQAAAPETGSPQWDRPRQLLLYHLGRWIYLIDAVDDLDQDRRAGRYNPVEARFPKWDEEDRRYLRESMDSSLALMGAAFQLLPETCWSGALENVIYSGLPTVEELVFSGKWGGNAKNRRRNRQ